MFDSALREPVADGVAELRAVATALTAVQLSSCSDSELLDLLRGFETARRQLAVFDQALIAELAQRGAAPALGYNSVVALLRDLLRVAPGEASARVNAATAFGPRQALDGSSLPALHPIVAAAQASGTVSAAHGRIVVDAVKRIPAALQPAHAERVESDLVRHAQVYDPATLARFARRHLDHLDPDGIFTDEADIVRCREFTQTFLPTGASHVRGYLDAETTELLATTLDTLARPEAASAGQPDSRTAAQRRHDALRTALRQLARADVLPTAHGVPATVLLTADATDWQLGRGLATTGHGSVISVRQARKIGGDDAQFVPVIMGKAKEITAYGTGQRLFTKAQRFALIARDRGCSWPGCDRPPNYCEAHHVTGWSTNNRTSVDDAALICDRHHDTLHRSQWRLAMINGRPNYIPPAWIDPGQTPIRNHFHDPPERDAPD